MASRGAYVGGTDGSDYAHRQRVVAQYQDGAALAKSFSGSLLYVQLAFALLGGVVLYFYTVSGVFVLSPWLFAACALPFLGYRALPRHKTLLLALYAFGAAITAAFIGITGLGAVLDALLPLWQSGQFRLDLVVALSVYVFAISVLLVSVYYARRTISVWSTPRARPAKDQ